MAPKVPLSPGRVLAIQISERTMSVLSILGSLFIVGTFLKWHYFRKPINRLVFYASWGNVMANVATLISTSALPARGAIPSPLCQFQAILIQWFMMADSLWVLCMALNVMMVFNSTCDIRRLRRLEKWYLLFSYGVPFVPCLAYIFLDRVAKRRILGGATIWCWVDSEVEWMRIAFFYAPVWIVISSTLFIYIYVGRTIFKQRSELRSFSNHAASVPAVVNPFTVSDMSTIVKKVDMRVTTETIDSELTVTSPCGNDSRESFSSTRNLQNPGSLPSKNSTASRFSRIDWTNPSRAPQDTSNLEKDVPSRGYQVTVTANNPDIELPVRKASVIQGNTSVRRTTAMDGNTAAWSYLKVAFLMFAALFIVWVPSTVNRLQQFINRDSPVFGLNLASALVLPLQGFWNAMVYASTTWPECKRAMRETLEAVARRRNPGLRQKHEHRKDSEDTLTTAEPVDMNAEIPLHEMLNSDPGRPVHSRVSSSETMKSPSASCQEKQ
ncbi:G protein coupled receptor family protein [Dendryphion nanum]|uniref:G protein coupled receptor family protein n=1 Tax=Dendryphion nanum TaxID=256645 RepID=A0A9P9INN2_9PLEO|nr:G protein coupled receptor family protein [Dendryphion nanum]